MQKCFLTAHLASATHGEPNFICRIQLTHPGQPALLVDEASLTFERENKYILLLHDACAEATSLTG